MAKIGPTFQQELVDAGITSTKIAWGSDGKIEWNGEPDSVRLQVQEVIKNHNPDAKPRKHVSPETLSILKIIALATKSKEEDILSAYVGS